MTGHTWTRLTWTHPEDLVGHELRQAGQDGRDPRAVRSVAARWRAAGGPDPPPRAGTAARPTPALRGLAERLLDELAGLPVPDGEPSGLDEIIAACPDWPEGGRTAPDPDRVLGAWLGRAAGCALGAPVEKIPREGIREIAEATGNWPIRGWFTAEGLPGDIADRWPWNTHGAATSLAENLDGAPPDDDLEFSMLALATLERHGRDFTTEDVARFWLEHLPGGRVFTAERVAYRNLLLGVEPPDTATYHNPFREWIGAQIRTDVYGWVNAGDPGAAAAMAHRDARLSHTANGVYGAMFVAAMCASAVTGACLDEVLAAGLSVVPPRSRLACAVRRAVTAARRHEDFERVLGELYASHGDLHWVHVVNNAALVAAALVHGAGDFTTSIAAAVCGGWDTDSDGATVGSIAGALTGARLLPSRWTTALRGRASSGLAGFDGVSFGELAARVCALPAPHRPGGVSVAPWKRS
ncbi:ADP-ribosylglycohydrolase family protein [Actinomadura alba]|uniref:ADP-ribosylglycohydrolase family protein n=1 Tax=Actinomadura alba TaxID=406431 RepID=A0ABR7M1B2_9ACTN|nr:ADP-ribosylglycohydrolase family protein [Actinomadura alba]MBC6470383.1 ADP-ribosylglycohydrolase family protein [Actinomadura alba]